LRMKHFLLIVLFCAVSAMTFAQIDRARIIAAYINNFARYTTWPDESQMDSFRIAVFTDNIDIKKEFEEFSKNRRIKDKPIGLSVHSTYPLPVKVQIILLTIEKSDYLSEVYDDIEGKPVLLVSEGYKDKRNVIINLYESQEQLFFEVNKANAINQHLIIDPEILLAGGTEIDVAGLYRSSQLSLRSMQKSLDKMEDSLEHLNTNIQVSIRQINRQQAEISGQKVLLDESDEKLNVLQKITLSQEAILAHQKDSINNKNRVLFNQQQDIKKRSQEGEWLEQILRTRQKQIEDLNIQIKNKNIVLGNQSETIFRQKQMLLLFIVIALLTVFLGVTIFISYRNNKQKSNILADQKREIEEKLEELKQLNIKLQNADQYKSIFLASMSHELRTPLNSIIGYTGILLMGMTGTLNDEQDKQLNKVKNNAKHLLSLINDILDISKIEADKIELHCEEFSLKSMVNEVFEIIHPKVIEKQLEMTTAIPDDIIVSTDLRRIKQVLLNLVSNAVNYSDSGIIHIQAERPSENKLRLSVKDTGIGIAENEIFRLFQPFQQIDSSLTKKNKGTGLGLYLCRKLMGLLQGDIYVKSTLGKGSEFYIEMPVKIN
jgi:signal transduction histidine kinase